MNDNPWHIESMARAQRERVQEEMRQIRLEEKALKAQSPESGLVLRLWLALQRWVVKRKAHPSPIGHYEPFTPAEAKRGS
jgi:hypothetical protein